MADVELLDCGAGRRLERFGALLADRPAPGATADPVLPSAEWDHAVLVYRRGAWVRGGGRRPWPVRLEGLRLECRPASGGQVGVFPEHARAWAWLDAQVRAAADRLGRQPAVLSLFAYTGGATLACARAGARVAHVDASRTAVGWARRNAELSGLADRAIRWLPDDVRAFVQRERRRGRRYDGVVLDPPTYGHGTGAWRIEDDLPILLEELAALAGPRPAFVLLTTHTPGFDGPRLGGLLRDQFAVDAATGPLELRASSGATLALGAFARSPVR